MAEADGLQRRDESQFLQKSYLARILSFPVDDPTLGQIIRGDLKSYIVTWVDADVVLAHLSADVGENDMTVLQHTPKPLACQWLLD